jgi:antitoxin CptB
MGQLRSGSDTFIPCFRPAALGKKFLFGVSRSFGFWIVHSGMDREIQRKRIKYRATHRGTKEADAIIGGFVTANIQDLSDDQLDALEVFLDCSDPDISDWLRGAPPLPDGSNLEILELVQTYQKNLLTD